MFQFYFLSIFLNLLSGVFIVFGNAKTKEDDTKFVVPEFLQKDSIVLVLAILSVFVGIVKLLAPVKGIALFGDLIPAVTGILGGACLLVEYYTKKSTTTLELPELLSTILVELKTYVGYICFISAFLHFLIPGALFL